MRRPSTTRQKKDERREAIDFCRRFHALCIEKELYLHEHNRTEYAHLMGTNHIYLSRKLKMASGYSLRQFIKAIRMTVAYQLLKSTNYDMTTIMSKCGYTDKSSFYRTFKQRFHCSPTSLRNRFFANA